MKYVMSVFKYLDTLIFNPVIMTCFTGPIEIYYEYESKEIFDKYGKEDKIILETLAVLKDPEEFKIWRENNLKENPRIFLKEKRYYNMLDS
mgnify:CR=1 FL=1